MKNRFELKPFQVDTVKALSETFIDLWKTNKYKIPFVFKSPTGSGKTIMMAEFLLSINDNYQFDEDKCYIWISFGDDTSYKQSMKKISDYFGEEFNSKFKDKSDLTEGSLGKNDMLFINWSSLKASNKDGRVLRAETEKTSDNKGIFDDFIINTKRERDIILIVDEAHTETDTALADEIIELINPRLIMKVTATPKELPSITDIRRQNAGFVEVYEEDVIESGLIKERLMIQTQEDIEKLPNTYVEEVTREGNIKLTPHPAFKVLVSTGEITRRSLRELGLTINSVAGTSGEDDVEDLIESVQKLKKNE